MKDEHAARLMLFLLPILAKSYEVQSQALS